MIIQAFVLSFFQLLFSLSPPKWYIKDTVCVHGHKYVLGYSQTHFNPHLSAQAKMTLSWAQNIFIPGNINFINLMWLVANTNLHLGYFFHLFYLLFKFFAWMFIFTVVYLNRKRQEKITTNTTSQKWWRPTTRGEDKDIL